MLNFKVDLLLHFPLKDPKCVQWDLTGKQPMAQAMGQAVISMFKKKRRGFDHFDITIRGQQGQ